VVGFRDEDCSYSECGSRRECELHSAPLVNSCGAKRLAVVAGPLFRQRVSYPLRNLDPMSSASPPRPTRHRRPSTRSSRRNRPAIAGSAARDPAWSNAVFAQKRSGSA
jgi:hypothetical protein